MSFYYTKESTFESTPQTLHREIEWKILKYMKSINFCGMPLLFIASILTFELYILQNTHHHFIDIFHSACNTCTSETVVEDTINWFSRI